MGQHCAVGYDCTGWLDMGLGLTGSMSDSTVISHETGCALRLFSPIFWGPFGTVLGSI